MIADLKPYPEYKESGLPWLAQVPGHWDLIPNRGLVHRRKVLVGKRHGDYRLLSLTKQGVIVRDISTGKGKFSSDMGTSQEVRNGDLVFCLFDVPETPRTVGLSQYEGMITGAYTVFESLGRCSSEYFELFYRAMDDRKLLSPLYSGLRHTIPVERFLGTKTPQPPPSEQAAIVRFLDYANGRLERAIRAKRNIIALLHEQKQAIIQSAVTGKLDKGPKKPSGIPWVGEIPRHWEVRRLSSVAHFASGKAHEQFVDAAGKHICVTARFVSTGGTARKFCTRNFSPGMKGDVLMVMSDLPNGRALARAFLIEDDSSYAVNQRVCIIRPYKMIPAFLAFQANRNWGLLRHDDHSNQTHLSNGDYKTLPLLCPPVSEQEEIVRAVDRSTKHIPLTIARLEREISLLREYRTRLVADVVTGKLDVREVAAGLPEEKNELVESDVSDPSDDPTQDDEPTPEDAS